MVMDKIALVFFALFLAALVALQNALKRKHIHPIITFSVLAAICLLLAIIFLTIALYQGQNP
jgi:hypothetical protein